MACELDWVPPEVDTRRRSSTPTCVLHFIADAEDPWQIVATLRDALAPGS